MSYQIDFADLDVTVSGIRVPTTLSGTVNFDRSGKPDLIVLDGSTSNTFARLDGKSGGIFENMLFHEIAFAICDQCGERIINAALEYHRGELETAADEINASKEELVA